MFINVWGIYFVPLPARPGSGSGFVEELRSVKLSVNDWPRSRWGRQEWEYIRK